MVQAVAMIARCMLLGLCVLFGVAEASVTAAWKLPLAIVYRGDKLDEELPKLEKPPGESAFFQAGDVLRDLKPLLGGWVGTIQLSKEDDGSPERAPFAAPLPKDPAGPGAWSGDWVVWNERSQMIVARGSYNDVFVIEAALGFWNLPCALQMKLELVAGDPSRSRSMQVIGRSGEVVDMEADGFAAHVEMVRSTSMDIIDARLGPSWPAEQEGRRWAVHSDPTLQTGRRTLIAAHGRGKSRWELFATASVLLPGGGSAAEGRWIEGEGKVEPWRRRAVDSHDKGILGSLPDGQIVRLYPVPFEELIWRGDGGAVRAAFAKVATPEAARDWMRGEAADLREVLTSPYRGTLSFAGFDSRSGQVLLIGDAEGMDGADAILWGLLWEPPRPVLWLESNAEAGGWALACRSGEKASIDLITTRVGEEGTSPFEIEPTTGSNKLVDLRFAMDLMPEDRVVGHIVSSTTLMPGHEQVVGAYTPAGGGEEVKLSLSVRTGSP